MDLAVTSPAEPANSPNAMDGKTFILRHNAAATNSNANIQKLFIAKYQHFTIFYLENNLKDIGHFHQERCLPEYVPVPGLRIDEKVPAMYLVRRANDGPEIAEVRDDKSDICLCGRAI